MNFASDNAGPMHPQVLEGLVNANQGFHMPYGSDAIMDGVRKTLRDVFEAPDAAVFLVSTGTAANALALSCFTKPYDAIFCHRTAHVEEDECGAPEFFANGAKLKLVDGPQGRMTPNALMAAMKSTGGSVHNVQRGPVSITQATETGTIYTCSQIAALSDVAKAFGSHVHLDGARFANALVKLDCTPADMTWRAGVDVVSFGGTKNGCGMVEAVIFFDPKHAWEFELRRKRGAHLFSKHRYLSGQMEGYLRDNLWLDLARKANAACARLADGLRDIGAVLTDDPQANLLFATLPRAAHRRAQTAGAQYYLMSEDNSLDGDDDTSILCRLVCDWSKTDAEIDRLIALLKG